MPESALKRAFTYERELLTSKFGPRTPLLLPVSLANADMTDKDLHALTERFPLTQHRQRGNTSSYLQSSPLETKTVSYILEEVKEQQQPGSDLAEYASRLKAANLCLLLCTKLLGDGHRPEAREGGTLTAVQGKLYLFGGRCRKLFNDVKVLDTGTMRWEEPKLQSSLGALPEPRVNHTTVAFQHSLVVYGGCERFNDILQIRNCFPLVHLYDTRTPHTEQHTWTSVKPAGRGPEARRCHCAAVVGKVLFFYGGMDRTGKVLEDLQAVNLGQGYADNMLWIAPSMSKRSIRPGARSGASFTLVFSSEALSSPNMDLFNPPKIYDEVFTPSTCGLYLIGGVNEKGIACNEVFVLRAKKMSVRDDRPSLMWVKPEISGVQPEPRYDHGTCLCRKLLFVYGGRDDSLFRTQSHCELRTFAILNIETQSWDKIELLGSPPSGRWGFAMTAVDSKIFIFGGMKLSKFCSSKLNILETDQNVVKDRAAGLRAQKKPMAKSKTTLRGGIRNSVIPRRTFN